MSNDLDSIIAKLKQPPSVPNWIRYNHPSVAMTRKAIVSFALGFPNHSLFAIYPIIGDMITFGTSEADALRGIQNHDNPKVCQLGREIIQAFAAFLRKEKITGIRIFEDFSGQFRVARDIVVPVTPTFVILENGLPTPVFFIGWTTMPFSDRQKRLLTTAIDDAVLSFSDFKGARGHIFCAPRPKGSKSERIIRHWTTEDHPRFSSEELNRQLDRYATALELAGPDIRDELARRAHLKNAPQHYHDSVAADQNKSRDQGDLFN
jgi:hypothetical protein